MRKKQFRIYVAGPMQGCDKGQMCDWRESVRAYFFKDHQVFLLDPVDRLDCTYTFAVEGDKSDIRKSDLIIANFWKPSIGTSMEVLFAYEHDIPVVSIDGDDCRGNLWLRYHSEKCFSNLDIALRYVRRKYLKRGA